MSNYINGITDLAKVDNAATLGLSGTNNSLAYRIGEVERHFHSYERWFGVAGTPSGTHKADAIAKDIAAFEIDAGNDAWGDWVQLLGSADTTQKYDLHKIFLPMSNGRQPSILCKSGSAPLARRH